MHALDRAQERMVAEQVESRGVRDAVLLQALRDVPREAFVSERHREFACHDVPLRLDASVEIPPAFSVAMLLEASELRAGHRVLEIGTGAGYLTAVLSRVVGLVVTIEWNAARAGVAEKRLHALGYRNVTVLQRPPTVGCAEAAPFDAIVVSTRCMGLPTPLLPQLRVGGVFAMSVGETQRAQRLLRIRRTGASAFHPEALGPAALVPVGVRVVGTNPPDPLAVPVTRIRARDASPAEALRGVCEPFSDDFDAVAARLATRVNGSQVVVMGGASDGTRQFHALRARLTRRLLEHEGFEVLAIDGDVEGTGIGSDAPLAAPVWSLRNPETTALLEWMRATASGPRPLATCGLDVFARIRSLRTALRHMQLQDARAADAARVRYASLTPWQSDAEAFDHASAMGRLGRMVPALAGRLCTDHARRVAAARASGRWHADPQLVEGMRRDAPSHYEEMLRGHPEAWSMRNRHLADALHALQRSRGGEARVVVWTTGPNAGHAGATEMGARGEASLGQLVRERLGSRACLIGMGTHHGSVTVASAWDGAPQVRAVPDAHRDSCERLLHETGMPRFLLPLRSLTGGEAHAALAAPRLQRFCGPVYSPENELRSHCYQTSLPAQFDEYAWFDETEALATEAVAT